MDFSFTEDVEAFRQEVRGFLAERLTPEVEDEFRHCTDYYHGFNKRITREIGEQGWLTMTWPVEDGGRGASIWHRVAFDEEMAAAHAPMASHQVAANFVGPGIVHWGTEAQRRRHLPPITRGEVTWAFGLTEPNAGTDLGSVETRADRDGDEWVINGSKMYTEHIQDSEWLCLMVRTDQEAPKHRGLSLMVIDPRTRGVQVTPLWTMDGYRVNQVFFEDVRVPADSLIGEENRGFYHLIASLNQSRAAGIGGSGLGGWASEQVDLDGLVRVAAGRAGEDGRPLIDDSWVQDGIADYAIYVRTMRLLAYRVASVMERGGLAPDKETSVKEVWWKHYAQEHVRFGGEMLGLAGQVGQESPEHAPMRARWQRRYMAHIAGAHNGGTVENALNTTAGRVLALPR